jgi:DNA-binding HxlR family transcriptional regulator
MVKDKYYKVCSEKVTMSGEIKLIETCPIQGVIDVISKKWSLLIVATLGNSTSMRYNQLFNELKGISPKTLADTLKDLSSEGIINRRTFPEIPPRVEYSLTEDGGKLREAVLPMIRWAVDRSSEKDCVLLKSVTSQKRTT